LQIAAAGNLHPTEARKGYLLMSNYDRAVGREFWYDFDNQALWRRTPEFSDALKRAYFDQGLTFDSLVDEFRASFARPDHPRQFADRIANSRSGFLDLAKLQLAVIDRHLQDNLDIQQAFQDFGQGVLYDDRKPRPPGFHVHMMDGDPSNWVGWQRWHASLRAEQELGADRGRWLHVNCCIGLAWSIQTEAKPVQDSQNNPSLAAQRVEELATAWMQLDTATLDWAFATHPLVPPSIQELRAHQSASHASAGVRALMLQARTGYAHVQEILEAGAGPTAHPMHDGHQRFWLLPYDQFMSLPPIYDHDLIAAPGPNRGERSGLVMALRGTLQDIPQMPLNRPPLAPADIAFISSWIDTGCPEI
jgi:hypothetical protein